MDGTSWDKEMVECTNGPLVRILGQVECHLCMHHTLFKTGKVQSKSMRHIIVL